MPKSTCGSTGMLRVGGGLSAILGMALGCVSPAIAAPAPPGPAVASDDTRTCSREQEAANKRIVEATLAKGPAAIFELIDPSYLQHNPEYVLFGELNGVGGRDAVKLYEQRRFGAGRPPPMMKPAPGQPRDDFMYRVIAECDTVIVVGEHWHPNPVVSGRFYATYFFNMWRMKNGKLVEHWDPDDLPKVLPDYLTTPVKDLPPVAPPPPPPPPPGGSKE